MKAEKNITRDPTGTEMIDPFAGGRGEGEREHVSQLAIT